MILTQFIDHFENKLNIQSIMGKAEDDKTRAYLQNDSERIYSGEPLKEVKNIAFMVQPQRELCMQAIESGCDTLFSHHRWKPKNSQFPVLRDLDESLKMSGVQMLSYHLYWDIARGGLADCIMTDVFNLTSYETSYLTYRGFAIPDLARWARTSLSFERINELLEANFIRTERFLGHLDWIFDRLVIIPGGGLENSILASLESELKYDKSEKIIVISSGSGQDSGMSYLEFFSKHEKNFSIVDVNHYDLEAVGVGSWARQLQAELQNVSCEMFYADHYINYSI